MSFTLIVVIFQIGSDTLKRDTECKPLYTTSKNSQGGIIMENVFIKSIGKYMVVMPMKSRKNITKQVLEEFLEKYLNFQAERENGSKDDILDKVKVAFANSDFVKQFKYGFCIGTIEKKCIKFSGSVAKKFGKSQEDYYWITTDNSCGSYDIEEVVYLD